MGLESGVYVFLLLLIYFILFHSVIFLSHLFFIFLYFHFYFGNNLIMFDIRKSVAVVKKSFNKASNQSQHNLLCNLSFLFY